MSQPESVNLFFTEGSSDKTYQAQLVEVEGGWKVNAQNGRRGGTLKAQIKTPEPVSYAEAKKIYDQLVKSKKKDGYTEDTSGSVYQDTAAGEEFTGVVPQLLNEVREEDDVEALLTDPNWIAQEKHDGERRLVRRRDEKVEGINRTGMRVPLAMGIADYFGGLARGSDYLVDGEVMGDRFVAFDLLEINGKDIRGLQYSERLALLENLVAGNADIQVVETVSGESAKRALAERVRNAGGEGIVFKRRDATWSAGKPASGGSQRKWKFTESATLEAGTATSGKRSVALLAIGIDGLRVHVGKATIPANHEVPAVGALVEVSYLYRMPGEGGCLFQPVYKGLRGDKTCADSLDSFKLKPAVVAPQKRKSPRP